jgi:hypothetical protein
MRSSPLGTLVTDVHREDVHRELDGLSCAPRSLHSDFLAAGDAITGISHLSVDRRIHGRVRKIRISSGTLTEIHPFYTLIDRRFSM